MNGGSCLYEQARSIFNKTVKIGCGCFSRKVTELINFLENENYF